MSSLSVYIHIPFCERKCVYCDFYSIENLSLRGEFVDLLLREVDLKLLRYPQLADRNLETVFFGGGTPSLLTPEELSRIVTKFREYFRIAPDCEFTMECNPGTVTLDSLCGYRELGVNRLSFGVQSFDAEELRFLGRIHDAEQAREAVRLAREAGFDNVSLDLIFALPGQSVAVLMQTLNEAIALNTDHISAYNLIVEHGTPLYRLVQLHKVIELDPDRAAGLFSRIQYRLSDAGFEQYEISNYAKSANKRARHNLVYWDGFKDYVSFGPSAHEFVGRERAWNVSSLEQYGRMVREGNLPEINRESLTLAQQRTEVLYLQLRSTGIRLSEFCSVFGEDLLVSPEVRSLMEEDMLSIEGDSLKLTSQGYRFCDGIVMRLMSTGHRESTPDETSSILSSRRDYIPIATLS